MDDVLTTERLVLRPVTTQDQAALQAHWDVPEVRRFLLTRYRRTAKPP